MRLKNTTDGLSLDKQHLEELMQPLHRTVGVAPKVSQTGETEAFVFDVYPNPFNPKTTIRFGLLESAYVTLVVYDAVGRPVQVLVEGRCATGTHEVIFEAGDLDLPGGTYLVRMEIPQGSFIRTMQLLK